MSNEKKHTQEPWDADFIYEILRYASKHLDMTEVKYNGGYSGDFTTFCEDHRANARRIVACVNTCAGIETEKLENTDEYSVCTSLVRNEDYLG